MTPKAKPTRFERIIQLVSDASLTIGFAKGSGLGAVLLAVIVVLVLVQANSSFEDYRPVFRSGRPVD